MSRSGFTLPEVVLSMGVASLLMAGIMSSVFVASRAIPSLNSDSQSSMAAFKIVDQLATELESALYVTQHTASTVGFTVPDRNGDGIPERVVYAWTGVAGGALTRRYNGGTPVTLAPNVNLFSLTPNYVTNTLSYPAVGTEDAAESVLIDYVTGASNTNKLTVKSTAQVGQYFTATLPAGATAWRPTRVQFMAQQNSGGAGDTMMQMYAATANMLPIGSALAQATVANSSLTPPNPFGFQQFSFSNLSPLSPTGGICLVLLPASGTQAAIVQNSQTYSGQLTQNNGTWQLTSNKSLMCQLFARLTRSSGTQYVNSRYLTSMGISLQIAPAAPVQTTTCAMLNHPELLAGLWELKFDKDPTAIDVNGDALGDWVIHGGGTFAMGSIVNQVWQSGTVQLDTSTANNFATTTVVDLRMQNTSAAGNGACFTMNALRSGSNCAPLSVCLDLQADGTQTLIVAGKTNDVTPQPLITLTGLANQLTDVNLIIDPVTQAVSITVGGVQKGTFVLPRFVSTDGTTYASIYASSSNANFSYARIRVLEQ